MNALTLDILKASLWNEAIPFQKITTEVYEELYDHTIHMLVYDVVEKAHIDEEILNLWRKSFARQIKTFSMQLNMQQELVNLLSSEGITPVILKGFASAMYYPEPAYRCVGDIDFLLLPRNEVSYIRASNLLLKKGYCYGHENSNRLCTFQKNGVEFEMHHFFTTKRTASESKFDEIINHSAPVMRRLKQWPEYEFYSFSDEVNGLIFLEHLNQHLISGVGFRQVLDWMFYVEAVVTDAFWEQKLKPLAEETGLVGLAKTVTKMNELYFGAPKHEWTQDIDKNTCDIFFNIVDEYGNFGNKVSEKDKETVGAFTSGIGIKGLQQRGLAHWSAAQKYKILRPFAWLYQICRYIKKGLFERDPNSEGLLKNYKRHREQKKLFKKLGLWQYRK